MNESALLSTTSAWCGTVLYFHRQNSVLWSSKKKELSDSALHQPRRKIVLLVALVMENAKRSSLRPARFGRSRSCMQWILKPSVQRARLFSEHCWAEYFPARSVTHILVAAEPFFHRNSSWWKKIARAWTPKLRWRRWTMSCTDMTEFLHLLLSKSPEWSSSKASELRTTQRQRSWLRVPVCVCVRGKIYVSSVSQNTNSKSPCPGPSGYLSGRLSRKNWGFAWELQTFGVALCENCFEVWWHWALLLPKQDFLFLNPFRWLTDWGVGPCKSGQWVGMHSWDDHTDVVASRKEEK